jgi:hypothetical protein
VAEAPQVSERPQAVVPGAAVRDAPALPRAAAPQASAPRLPEAELPGVAARLPAGPLSEQLRAAAPPAAAQRLEARPEPPVWAVPRPERARQAGLPQQAELPQQVELPAAVPGSAAGRRVLRRDRRVRREAVRPEAAAAEQA